MKNEECRVRNTSERRRVKAAKDQNYSDRSRFVKINAIRVSMLSPVVRPKLADVPGRSATRLRAGDQFLGRRDWGLE